MRALLVLLALAGTARADGDWKAGAKALVAEQARALLDKPTKQRDLPDTFTSDGVALIGPKVAVGPGAIAEAVGDTGLRGGDLMEIVAAKPTHVNVAFVSDDAAAVTADLAITANTEAGKYKWTLRLAELVVRDGDHWSAKVAQITAPIADKDAQAILKGDHPTPDPIPNADASSAYAEELASPAKLAAAIPAGKDAVVLGSAPKETSLGAAKAKKLLGKWAKLSFTIDGGVASIDDPGGAWSCQIANLNVAVGKVTMPLRVLVIRRSGEGAFETVVVDYGFSAMPGAD